MPSISALSGTVRDAAYLQSEALDQPAETLAERITELAAHISAATCDLLLLIERFDRQEGWGGLGMKSCAHWLNWQCGMSLGSARERVRVARALPGLPKIRHAFATGRVSYAKVRAMTRVATPENEDVLLNVAFHGTASHVEQQVRGYRKVKRLAALQEEQERHCRRELKCFEDEDGSWVVRGRLTAEQGALLERALERAGEELWREQRDVPEAVSAETPQAPVTVHAPQEGAVRKADAFARVMEGFLAAGNGYANGESPKNSVNRKSGMNGGDRCCIHLHTNVETLQSVGGGKGYPAEAELEVIPGRPAARVSAETSRRLACDAAIVRWKEDAEGNALDIGRKSRTVPPAVRRALERRDGGCRFPGCSCTRYVDAHHVVHWADGGTTSLENLVLLCRTHHRKVHEEGFGVHMKNGRPVFKLPSGTVIPETGESRFRGNVTELKRRHAATAHHITPATIVPAWRGERMDLAIAVLGLIQRE